MHAFILLYIMCSPHWHKRAFPKFSACVKSLLCDYADKKQSHLQKDRDYNLAASSKLGGKGIVDQAALDS